MNLNRAYSLLEIKSVSEDQRIITGIATTPSPDRYGDVVEPLGVEFKNPMPLLWQHRASEPVGDVSFDKPTKAGIGFKARMPKVDEAGKLKDRIDEAWQSVKLGLVKAVSIGFVPIEYAFMDSGGVHYQRSEVLELSLVTIPAQSEARIDVIKALDAPLLAASGISSDGARPIRPASRDSSSKAKTMRTIQEQITTFEASRAAKVAAMEGIMSAGDGATTLDQEQQEQYDTLDGEVKSIDGHLSRLHNQNEVNKRKAAPVVNGGGAPATASRTSVVIVKQAPLAKGIPFVRMVSALAACKGNRQEAAAFADRWQETSPEVGAVLRVPLDQIEKAAVAPGTTTGTTWAEPLVQYTNMASEFIDYLRPLTIMGQIRGFRIVPFKIKVPRQTAGAAVNWVGEAKPKPLSALAFDSVTLDFFKIAGIVPLSEELVRFSSPAAEQLVRDDLAKAIAQFSDSEFIDPAKALVAGVSPASITNGVAAIPASGTTAAAFRTDVKAMFNALLTAGITPTGGHWIMKQGRALSLGMMVNALGQAEFPGVGIDGGTLLGFPVVVSETVPNTGGSPGGGDVIIFAVAPEIMLADGGSVTIDVSREASLQMESAPDSPVTGATVMVSLWQHNLIGIKAELYINWLKRRAAAVQMISGAKYA